MSERNLDFEGNPIDPVIVNDHNLEAIRKYPGDTIRNESDEDFLARLKRLSADGRYSNEFLGIVIRARFPRVHN